MAIGRTVLAVVLFMALIFGMRWAGNALVQKVISDVKDPKDNWWGKGENPFQGKPLDIKIEPLDMEKFNQGYLYKPHK